MKDKKDQWNEQQSLQTIHEMIEAAKENISDNGFHYLLWGWLVFAAAILHFLLIQVKWEYHWVVWPVLMPLGGIVAGVYIAKGRKTPTVRTHIDRVLSYLWGAFTVALLITLFFLGSKGGWYLAYPMTILLYGLGSFVSGGALRFKPLIIGGAFCGVLSVVSFYVTFEYQLLLIAAAIASSHIIPGHILRKQFNNKKNQD